MSDSNGQKSMTSEVKQRSRSQVSAQQSWRLIAGSVLVTAGALAIFSAWMGVRNLLHPADQVPYLISGGIGGLGLILVAVWLFRSHETELMKRYLRRTARKIEQLETEVSALRSIFDGAQIEVASQPKRGSKVTEKR